MYVHEPYEELKKHYATVLNNSQCSNLDYDFLNKKGELLKYRVIDDRVYFEYVGQIIDNGLWYIYHKTDSKTGVFMTILDGHNIDNHNFSLDITFANEKDPRKIVAMLRKSINDGLTAKEMANILGICRYQSSLETNDSMECCQYQKSKNKKFIL